jgi:hypothetical protein
LFSSNESGGNPIGKIFSVAHSELSFGVNRGCISRAEGVCQSGQHGFNRSLISEIVIAAVRGILTVEAEERVVIRLEALVEHLVGNLAPNLPGLLVNWRVLKFIPGRKSSIVECLYSSSLE